MAGTSDKVFLRAYKWFKAALDQLQAEIPPGGAIDLSGTLTDIVRTKLGLELDKTAATIEANATGIKLRGFHSNSNNSTANRTAAIGVAKTAAIPPAAPATSRTFRSAAER